MNEAEIRAALGIDEDADIAEAIASMKATINAQAAVIATDSGKSDTAEVMKLRAELTAAHQKLLALESENAAKIRQLQEERRKEQAQAKVETLIAKGRIVPAMRETALNLAEMLSPEKFDEFVATLPAIDMTERGVASNHELAELEVTPGEIAVARQLGIWNDADPAKSRLAIMRQKAASKGLTLPAEIAG